MSDKRTKEPSSLWRNLLSAIFNDGVLEREIGLANKPARKTMKGRIKKMLCDAFNTIEDPFEKYQQNIGWRLKLKIQPTLPDQVKFERSMVRMSSDSIEELAGRIQTHGQQVRKKRRENP
jgi:hypothetical protein